MPEVDAFRKEQWGSDPRDGAAGTSLSTARQSGEQTSPVLSRSSGAAQTLNTVSGLDASTPDLVSVVSQGVAGLTSSLQFSGRSFADFDESRDNKELNECMTRYVSSIQDIWSALEQDFHRSDLELDLAATSALDRIPSAYRVRAGSFVLEESPEFGLVSQLDNSVDLGKVEVEVLRTLDRYIRYCNICLEAQVHGKDPSAIPLGRGVTSGILTEAENSLVETLNDQKTLWQHKIRAFYTSLAEYTALRKQRELERRWTEQVIVMLEHIKSFRDTFRAASLFVEHHDLLRAADLYQAAESCTELVTSKAVLPVGSVALVEPSSGQVRELVSRAEPGQLHFLDDFRRQRGSLKRKLGTALEHQIIGQFEVTFGSLPDYRETSTFAGKQETVEQAPSLSLATLHILSEETAPFALALLRIGSAGGALYRIPAQLLSDFHRLVLANESHVESNPVENFATFVWRCRLVVEGIAAVIDTFYAVCGEMDVEESGKKGASPSLPESRDVFDCFQQGFCGRFRECLSHSFLGSIPADGTELRPLLRIQVEACTFFRFLGGLASMRGASTPVTSLALADLHERLRQALQNHAEQKLRTIQASLDAERWTPSTRTETLQRLTNRLVGKTRRRVVPPKQPENSNETGDEKGPTTEPRTVSLLGERFVVIDALENLLELIDEYVECFHNAKLCEIGSITHSLSMRVLEALKAFNQRAMQLVLGAGSMRSASLKAITAKHLAVCTRTLDFMLKLLRPDVQEHYDGLAAWFCRTGRTALSPTKAVDEAASESRTLSQGEFCSVAEETANQSSSRSSSNGRLVEFANRFPDTSQQGRSVAATEEPPASAARDPVLEQAFERTLADYEVHRNQLLNKIVVIMQGRLRNRIAELRHFAWQEHRIQWQGRLPEASPWISALTKDFTTLHRILSPILSVTAQREVLDQILSSYAASLREEFARLTEEYLSCNHEASNHSEKLVPESVDAVLIQLAADAAALAKAARSLKALWEAQGEPSCLSDLDALAHTYQSLAEKRHPRLWPAAEVNTNAVHVSENTN
ncbi:hypothetical protein CCYA_CCYA06G1726 [Cyanidiococcus yangmingshanensis]|nr:hypothetical protein CCYA_CCYA06G1726 [Cyanidiococcus yangmingshanensis]